MISLIVGSTGAGKTTFSKELSTEISAAVYSIDNWMKCLFGDDMPDDPSSSWFYENQKWYTDRIARCENLIKKTVLQRALLGQKSILDLGFATRSHRVEFISYFSSKNVVVETMFLNIPASIRKARVEKRNLEKGETYVMTVDDTLFDFMESIFEPPIEDEGAKINIIES